LVRFRDHPADGLLQPFGEFLAVRAHVGRHGFSPRQCDVNLAQAGDLQQVRKERNFIFKRPDRRSSIRPDIGD